MVTKEMISDAITKYFLSDIIDYIPVQCKLKRKTVEGIIQRNLTQTEQRKLSLNECLNQVFIVHKGVVKNQIFISIFKIIFF